MQEVASRHIQKLITSEAAVAAGRVTYAKELSASISSLSVFLSFTTSKKANNGPKQSRRVQKSIRAMLKPAQKVRKLLAIELSSV